MQGIRFILIVVSTAALLAVGPSRRDDVSNEDAPLQDPDGRLILDGGFVAVEDASLVGGGFTIESDLASIEIEALSADGFEMLAETAFASDPFRLMEDLLVPAAGGGVAAFPGDLTLGPDATVIVEIAGGECDQILVTGTAELGGHLVIRLANGFEPAWGDEFVILRAGAVVGDFAAIESPALANGFVVRVEVRDTSVVVVVERNE